MRILLLGDSCVDVYHYGSCTRLCPDAPVPVFKSINYVKNGGMAKNVENNIKSIDKNTDVDIITNKNWESIIKTRYVDEKTNHMFLRVDENDDKIEKISLNDLKKINFEIYDAVVVSDYNKGFLSIDDLEFISNSHPVTFLDTKKKIDSWSKNFKFIKVNNIEFENSKNFLVANNSNLIVTKGQHGCVYRDKTFAVKKVDVKDTSGAGDTFLAALCVKYCKNKNIDEAINFANKCATIVVQKKGVVTL